VKPIAVLGTGPAGLLAAHGVGLTGKPVAVFGLGQKSVISGAQFLHTAIPELTQPDEPDTEVNFLYSGTPQGYKEKVYGTDPNHQPSFVSFDNLKTSQPAWNLCAIYDYLWESFGERSNQVHINHEWLEENKDSFEAIISTIPALHLCRSMGQHVFVSQEVFIGDFCMKEKLPDNTVYYEGTREISWTRCSRLFGIGGTEWSPAFTPRPPYQVVSVRKPIRMNCDCYPEVIKVGRYGAWKKGELTHDAFFKSLRALNDRGIIDIGPKVAP
jgi:hypothetical protein